MSVQVIVRDGREEYAVVPWDEYQALLKDAGRTAMSMPAVATAPVAPPFSALSALREAQGLSRQALARAVGISPAYLGMIEGGERAPDTAIRRALARALGTPGWEDEA